MTYSKVSSAFTRTTGLEDLADVVFEGRGLFRPQSPLARDGDGVAMDARIGWGRVAVSEPWTNLDVGCSGREAIACGRENRRELRRRFAVGESLGAAMTLARLLRRTSIEGGFGPARAAGKKFRWSRATGSRSDP